SVHLRLNPTCVAPTEVMPRFSPVAAPPCNNRGEGSGNGPHAPPHGVTMSIVIRDVREHELDSVLALNNNAGLAILPLDAHRLHMFYETAEYFRIAERDGNLAGFLIGFGSESDHDSSNFAWFRQHLDSSFFYIDRIVVAS